MLKINFKNLYTIAADHGMPESTFADHQEYLEPSLEKIEARGQGFYKVIDNNQTVKSVIDFAQSVDGKYTDIVICGIGGSALGPVCLRDAFSNWYQKYFDV